MRFKVGDRVRIKSLDWYNENKDKYGDVNFFIEEMSKFCGEIMTIKHISEVSYIMEESDIAYGWTDEMIEGLVEEEVFIKANDIYNEEYSKGEYCHEQSFKWGFQEGYNYSHENDKLEISLKEGYIFKDENGNVINAQKIVLEKKGKKYPKTYEECCRVLGVSEFEYNHTGTKVWYRHRLMATLDKLMLCRDAYWKLAGEEMGLNRPWKPDYDSGVNKYGIICLNGVVQESNPTTNWERHLNKVLDFPTAEMRDAFYENFKELIEI